MVAGTQAVVGSAVGDEGAAETDLGTVARAAAVMMVQASQGPVMAEGGREAAVEARVEATTVVAAAGQRGTLP